MTWKVPLIVDLDGTLIKVDSLQEVFVQLVCEHPAQGLRALLQLMNGRVALKAAVAELPFDEAALTEITNARTQGRKVYLATTADRRFVDAIAESLGLFVFA